MKTLMDTFESTQYDILSRIQVNRIKQRVNYKRREGMNQIMIAIVLL